MNEPSSLVPLADLEALTTLESQGVVKGGMRPKITAARAALQGGVPAVHLVSGLSQDGLLTEVFTNEGTGTLVVADIGKLAPAELAAGNAQP